MKMRQNIHRHTLMPFLLLWLAMGIQAQTPGVSVDWRDAQVKDVGAYMIDMEVSMNEHPVTHHRDTTVINRSRTVWQSEGADVIHISNNAFYQSGEPIEETTIDTGNAQADSLLHSLNHRLRKVTPKEQTGCLAFVFKDFSYNVFTFEYPSIDAKGRPVTLSAIAACPTKDGVSRVNNVILGTHITITNDNDRPSAQTNGFEAKDWGMLFALAAGNKLDYAELAAIIKFLVMGVGYDIYDIIKNIGNSLNSKNSSNCLVVVPDYEGYGLTKNRPHPYLFQELTARQCVDALLYAKALYQSAPELRDIRHPIRDNYRCLACGYSQGGSVAMASHRFIEQSGMDKDLHFVGSICGDGPYDPMATLMYYIKRDLDGEYLTMPLVLPLILKGMIDSNPYMRNYTKEDFFTQKFIDTGIFDWLDLKIYSTNIIPRMFAQLYDEGKDGDKNYFHNFIWKVETGKDDKGNTIVEGKTKLNLIVKPEFYNYFKNLYDTYKDSYTSANGIPLPTHRGMMEDLHLALVSNDMTQGWQPKHPIQLFHSKDDTIVPFVNAQSAVNRLGDNVTIETIDGQDHMEAGASFFSQSKSFYVPLIDGLRLCEYVDEMADRDY